MSEAYVESGEVLSAGVKSVVVERNELFCFIFVDGRVSS